MGIRSVIERTPRSALVIAVAAILFIALCAGLVMTDAVRFPTLMNSIVYGLINASLYMLIALGLTLLFGMMNIINFAHGAIYMLGAFGIYYFYGVQTANYFLAFALAVLFMGILGIVVERGVYRPLRGNLNANLVALLGLNILISSAVLLSFGTLDKSVPTVFKGVVEIGFLNVSLERLVVIPFSIALLFGLYLLLYKTKFGRGMRAVSQDREAAGLQAVNVNAINALAFAVSFSLAGAAGALIAPFGRIDPAMGFKPLLISVIIIILGGLGSLRGAILGALIVGLFESVGTIFFGSDMAYLYLFLFLFVLLIFRPQGLFGHEHE